LPRSSRGSRGGRGIGGLRTFILLAMLGAIGLAWLVIEIGIVRRIAALTRRTRGLSQTVHADGGLERYDLADLRGRDELGLLAAGLEPIEREQVRYEERCEKVADGYSDERVVGYRVRYDFHGHQGWTETPFHPGTTLRVRVDVTPVF